MPVKPPSATAPPAPDNASSDSFSAAAAATASRLVRISLRTGRPKANVLPEPVSAAPMISLRPSMALGRTRFWMGVGSWKPWDVWGGGRGEVSDYIRDTQVGDLQAWPCYYCTAVF